jgi:hypothetical protein
MKHKPNHPRKITSPDELAPPEEQAGRKAANSSNNGNGKAAKTIEAGSVKIPKGLIDEAEPGERWYRPSPMVMLILCVSLAFIIYIAYLIASEPLVNSK